MARERKKGRLLVIPKAGVSDTLLNRSFRKHGMRSRRRLEKLNAHIYELPDGVDEAEVKKELEYDPFIKSVEFDELVPPDEIDPLIDSWAVKDIEANRVWNELGTTGKGIDVAICDTGINTNHPLLKERVKSQFNVVSNTADPSKNADTYGHGTKVAGAALNIAPEINLHAIKISEASNGYAYYSDMAKAIKRAGDQRCNVANISYTAISPTIALATKKARDQGCFITISAGNTGNDPKLPSDPNAVVVAATNSNGTPASFSSYGSHVDISAPGASIRTTSGTGYANASGTSFAAPTVAGVAALVMEANKELSVYDVENIILNTATPLPGNPTGYGIGKVNAYGSVAKANPPKVVESKLKILTLLEERDLEGNVFINIEVSDNIDMVELRVDDYVLYTDDLAPFSFVLDTTQLGNGYHNLVVIGYEDGEPVANDSKSINITNPEPDIEVPIVTLEVKSGLDIQNKTDGVIEIYISATDDSGAIQTLVIKANDQEIATVDGSDGMLCSWDTTKVEEGDYVLIGYATDPSGNIGESLPIHITVDRTIPEPLPEPTPDPEPKEPELDVIGILEQIQTLLSKLLSFFRSKK